MNRTRACLLCAMLVIALCRQAAAVIVAGNYANTSDANVNITAPADDFGFYNVGAVGSASAIYLGTDGDGAGWVLSANHVSLGATSFTFPNPSNPSQLVTASYNIVNNSAVLLNNTSGAGAGHHSDLVLYRIDPNSSQYGLPNLPRLNIANSTPTSGSVVTGVGRGVDRGSSIAYWDANWQTTTQAQASWSGYTLGSVRTMRWGDNAVTSTNINVNVGTQANPVYVNTFWTQFSQFGTANEFQATNGDSGGGVFQKVGGQWYLSGMIEAVTMATTTQPSTDAVFGTSTLIADLSYYRTQIEAIVPEPATGALALLGAAAGFIYVVRRHRPRGV